MSQFDQPSPGFRSQRRVQSGALDPVGQRNIFVSIQEMKMATRISGMVLCLAIVTACGGDSDGNIELVAPPATLDPPPVSNSIISAGDPALSGMFMLGPEDYYTHTAKMGEAPALVHFFADWFDERQLVEAQTQLAAPRPIDFNEFEVINFAFQPETVVAITWALPLPNFDVEGRHYENIPSVQDILDGNFDAYIRTFAQAIDRIELPVMLTLFGEIDNNAFYSFGPLGRNSAFADPDIPEELDVPVADELKSYYGANDHPDGPERVRDAFKHVIDIFIDEGVTSPSWFMYGSTGFMSTEMQDEPQQIVDATREWNQAKWYYPGDQYIEWVGKSLHHSDLASLQNQFELAYAEWGALTSRPFFSPEYSIRPQVESRASQIRQEFADYLIGFARLKAVAIVDQDPLTSSGEFGFFTLGGVNGEFPDEIGAWQESVIENTEWKTIVPE